MQPHVHARMLLGVAPSKAWGGSSSSSALFRIFSVFLLLSFCFLPLPSASGATTTTKTKALVVPATPWFSPASGTYSYTGGIVVKISGETDGATIYYTTDGSTPTAKSLRYSKAIVVPPVSARKTFKAIAILNNTSSWSVGSATYNITPPLPTPTYSPDPGTYIGTQKVTLTSAIKGAVIHYTIDGSSVSDRSPVYTGPITVAQTTNILALAAGAPGYSTGSYTRGHYTIKVPTPVITPPSGTYSTAPTIVMSDPMPGAAIYYTLDGSIPSSWAIRYTGPFALTANSLGTRNVQAIAIVSGLQSSSVAQTKITFSLAKGVIASAVTSSKAVATIPTDFLGFSHDWKYAGAMLGTASTGSNPIYPTLVKHLTDNMEGPLIIRVGANGTDVSGVASATTVQPFLELTQKASIKFILGVNLGSGNLGLAKQQASTFVAKMPSSHLLALEIGNEPDGYSTNGLRSSSYSFNDFLSQYQDWHQALGQITKEKVAIAGPTLGTGYWNPDAADAITAGTLQADILTQHEYLACYDPANLQPSDYLLQPASAQMHLWTLTPYLRTVHPMNLPFRIAEMNSMCSGGQMGVSNTFSSALWGIDAMFEYARLGVSGVNWMTSYLGGPYDLFQMQIWRQTNGMNGFKLVTVRPLYYGLLLFSRAAGNEARVLPVSTVTSANIKVWATVDATGKAHLVILNKDKTSSGNVQVKLPGYAHGTVSRLEAKGGYTATSGVIFGGQTFDNSSNGNLQGSVKTEAVTPNNDVWTVAMPPVSAALVDLQY